MSRSFIKMLEKIVFYYIIWNLLQLDFSLATRFFVSKPRHIGIRADLFFLNYIIVNKLEVHISTIKSQSYYV